MARDPNDFPAGWIEVDSSCLSAIHVVPRGPSACDLDVEFRKSGRRYRYHRLPYGEIADLLSAPSIGTHFNANIRDTYSWRPM